MNTCEVKKELQKDYNEVLTTDELQNKYIVNSFGFGYCFVTEKETGTKGSLSFTHMPRYYFNFVKS
jgi:hypothetical protein